MKQTMRRIYVNLAALAFLVFGIAMSTTSVKGQVLINLTNQVWKYDQSGVDPGAFWDSAYDDSAWSSGRSILAFEDSTGTVAVAQNITPYTNTVLLAPPAAPGAPNHTVDYFRAHFTFSGAGNPDTWVLTSSNLVDDGFVMYLNGVEVDRYNMNANDTLAAAANPAGEGVYVVRQLCIPAGTLHTGDNVLAVRVHQNAGTSSDVVWGTVLHASAGSAPAVTSPTGPVNVPLRQGTSSNLVVTVQAAPCATYQWYKNGAPISGATAASYTIANMDSSQAGTYFLRVVNAVGTTDSPNFNVTFDQDTTPPTVRGASFSPTDLRQVTINFSEDVIDVTFSPFDPLAFYLEDINNPNNVIGVDGAGYGTSSNIVVLTLSAARDTTIRYNLIINNHGIYDRFNNHLADPTIVRVTEPVVIQEGINGYASTVDTEVRFSAPDSAAGGNQATVNADLSDGSPAGPVHSLLRFDNLIGGGPNQVPAGAIINSAQLRIYTDDQTTAAGRIRLARMNVTWSEASTWNSMGNGIDQTNGVEAGIVDAIIDGSQDNSLDTMDVTAAVQAWANGAPNYGWVFLPSSTDGWRWATSENGVQDNRPRLIVDYTIQTAPCNIGTQPAGGTIPEKSPLTLSVVSSGSDLTYQWYFDPAGGPVAFSPIAGATSSTYTVPRAVPANSGTYYVVVQNNIPSTCTSANAVVTVTPDTVGPVLTSALGNSDQRTISLTFNDTLDAATAGNPATYSLSGGLTISGVALNGSSVTLTSSAPRTVGQNYTLTITGLRDDAVARNLIVPNPTSTNLTQQIVLLPFSSTWKFETNGLDLGAAGQPWSTPGYNDSAWPSAGALLGHEDTAATYTALYNQGLNTNNMFLWQLMRPDGTPNITYYVRATMPAVPFSLSGAGTTVTLRHTIDDGAVFYLNGVEAARYNLTNNPVTYTDLAPAAAGEGVIRTATITNLPCGQPVVVAAEIHQSAATSSDVLFGAELVVTGSNFGTCGGSALRIVNNGNGTVTLSWTGSGTLQQSTDLTNWTPAPNQNNPQTFTPVGLKFYRVQ
ncbi:MAG TPA: DNRLRE domain-containing protein [Verrucomicrobiae bacterium]|nr:DNRLRE domain-containing protein [Verrucomicrobiae bacterium]